MNNDDQGLTPNMSSRMPRAHMKPADIVNKKIDPAQSRAEFAHNPQGRPPRVPMGMTLNLEFPHLNLDHKNYYYRIFRDYGGRLQQAYQAYYEHVKDVDGQNAVCFKGLHPQYLMKLPRHYWEEDQKLKYEKQSATLRKDLGKEGLDSHEYIPDGKQHVVSKGQDFFDPLA